MKFKKKQASIKQNIPTASLPDIIFNLLIFFMVTTVLREYDVKVQYTLPSAKAIEKIDNKRLVSYIWVGNDGRIQIDDNLVSIQDIQTIAARKRQEIPNVIMSLRIDEGVRMGIVTDIQQQLRKGDALRINYSALQKLWMVHYFAAMDFIFWVISKASAACACLFRLKCWFYNEA